MDASTIINYFLSSVVIGFIIKEVFQYRKTKADTSKTNEETESLRLANQSADLHQIGEQTKLLKQMLADTEESTNKARELQQSLEIVGKEKFDLKLENDGLKYVIGYQKDERQEWFQMLKTAMEQTAEQKIEINQLQQIQKEHTRQIDECTQRDNEKGDLIKNFETRLNVMVGMMQQAGLPIPEGFNWKNIVEQEKVNIEPR